jgi:hypothetical protein
MPTQYYLISVTAVKAPTSTQLDRIEVYTVDRPLAGPLADKVDTVCMPHCHTQPIYIPKQVYAIRTAVDQTGSTGSPYYTTYRLGQLVSALSENGYTIVGMDTRPPLPRQPFWISYTAE